MHAPALPFESLYAHGFLRVAVCTPRIDVARPRFNLEQTLELARLASAAHAAVALFPELGLSAYSNEDLFAQDALLDEVEAALAALVQESSGLFPLLIVGAPLRTEQKLFNCALVIHRGEILGVVPKAYLPNYREFYEKRQFSEAAQALLTGIRLLGHEVPFGNDLLFKASDIADFNLHVEICEDLWVPIPPSSYAALAGATVLANQSASDITIGKADYRRMLCASQSGRCVAAYLYAAAGYGESTTDLAWDGHAIVSENGDVLAESSRFAYSSALITADIDLDRLRQERMRLTSFNDSARQHRERARAFRSVEFAVRPPSIPIPLQRSIARFPYVPSDPASRDERCAEVYEIQVQGLMRRLQASGIRKAVIGVSGGLDSTQALLVTTKCFDRLQLPRDGIIGVTLPGFATSERTYGNARRLMTALGVATREIDIRPAALRMLEELQHPFARGEAVYDTTFENVQAGERASCLFRLANHERGLVVGTADLSELALGYTTYGVGDHMAHYHVNASVPKSLIQHLIRWNARTMQFDASTCTILEDIAATPISPELIPEQSAEQTIGPYALQDFNLYYISRFGFRPSKVAFMALHAWADRNAGDWPQTVAASQRCEYDLSAIVRWLEVFLSRFFESSQFKRSALPNAPKVGSGGALSPRADWRAPSDSHADVWLDELHSNIGKRPAAPRK
jgi:NAD+ synthase (glutamine-hydrolysing)